MAGSELTAHEPEHTMKTISRRSSKSRSATRRPLQLERLQARDLLAADLMHSVEAEYEDPTYSMEAEYEGETNVLLATDSNGQVTVVEDQVVNWRELSLDEHLSGVAYTESSGRSSVFIAGSDGDDTISISYAGEMLRVNDAGDLGPSNNVDRLIVQAGAGDDTIENLTEIASLLSGGAGDDRIQGGSVHDRIFGGSGVDVIRGGAGMDTIDGGAGADTLYGNEDSDVVYGGAGSGADVLYGGGGNDELDGGGGSDELHGDAGNDMLRGGFGADTLRGGDGDDRLLTDVDDTANGGPGLDRFVGPAAADPPQSLDAPDTSQPSIDFGFTPPGGPHATGPVPMPAFPNPPLLYPAPTIAGGRPDSVHDQVVRINDFCSGTLITRQHVLTAGHCVDSRTTSQQTRSDGLPDLGHEGYSIQIGVEAEGFVTSVPSGRVSIHPGYEYAGVINSEGKELIQQLEHDIAIITLAEPLPVEAFPKAQNYNGENLYGGPLQEGDEGLIVGYATGIRLAGEVEIDRVEEGTIHWTTDEAGEARIQPGDSGGPMFVNANGLVIAGVHSSTGTESNESTDVRVAAYKSWIITTVGLTGDSQGPRVKLLGSSNPKAGKAQIQVEFYDTAGIKEAGIGVVYKGSLEVVTPAKRVGLEKTGNHTYVGTYEFDLSHLGGYELRYTAEDHGGSRSEGVLKTFPWTKIQRAVSLDGRRHARTIRGDKDLHTDDKTGVRVSYEMRAVGGREVMLHLSMTTFELHKDGRTWQDTIIRTERSDIKLFEFELPSGDPRYIKDIRNTTGTAYRVVNGEVHHNFVFNGGRVGKLKNLVLHIDERDSDDRKHQRLNAIFSLDVNDLTLAPRSNASVVGPSTPIAQLIAPTAIPGSVSHYESNQSASRTREPTLLTPNPSALTIGQSTTAPTDPSESEQVTSVVVAAQATSIPVDAAEQGRRRVADLTASNGEAIDDLDLVLKGPDAERFEIIGNGIYLRADAEIVPSDLKFELETGDLWSGPAMLPPGFSLPVDGDRTPWHHDEFPEDVNGDEILNLQDLRLLFSYLSENTGDLPPLGIPDERAFVDVNGDGMATLADLRLVFSELKSPSVAQPSEPPLFDNADHADAAPGAPAIHEASSQAAADRLRQMQRAAVFAQTTDWRAF